jgi:hypothetical protein
MSISLQVHLKAGLCGMGCSRKDHHAILRGREEKFVSDNSKFIRTSEGGRGVNRLTSNFLCGGGDSHVCQILVNILLYQWL